MCYLNFSLLGPPIIQHGEHTLTFSTRKAPALLIYLAVEGGTHTRQKLSEAFWPELDAEHGRAALRATLLEIRKHLERPHGPGEQAHLLAGRDTLSFDQGNPPSVDLRLIEAACKQSGAAHTDEARSALLVQLEQAVQQIRGPFLAGFTLRDSSFFDDWTRQQQEYWHQRIQYLFTFFSHFYERSGEREPAINVINRWLNFDPLSEEAYRLLMRLRFAQGDRVGALRAYATCRAVLTHELQIEPEPETTELAELLRHTIPIRQSLTHQYYPSTGQPSASLLDGSLLGRSTELSTLSDCYQSVQAGQSHLVLLQGESGMGKTRLASEFVGWAQAQGARVLAGQVLQTERPLLYQPLIDLLRSYLKQEHAPDKLLSAVWWTELLRLLPELRERFPNLPVPSAYEECEPQRLFEAITHLIRRLALRRPLVLWLDDLQWADTGTLDFLLYLARSLAQQPAPVLLLLNLRTGDGAMRSRQITWVQALKRTRISLAEQVLVAFTKEEMHHFVQALSWAEPPCQVEHNASTEQCLKSTCSPICQQHLTSLTNWLYRYTGGRPFSLIEMLKELCAREIILPVLQENGSWRLVLRSDRLAHTTASELIPSSIREQIVPQLGQLTPSAWAFLVAAAVLRTNPTFEQLCQIAQISEQEGLQALEELVHSGLLCKGSQMEEAQALVGYRFPGEMICEVVSQEAGAIRQQLIEQRMWLIMQEEVLDDQEEPSGFLYALPLNRQGQQIMYTADDSNKRGNFQHARKDAPDRAKRFADNRGKRTNQTGKKWRGTAEQDDFFLSRPPPGSPSNVSRAYIGREKRM